MPRGMAVGLVVPVPEVLSYQPEVWMSYCPEPGVMLHAFWFVQSPWNRLSGVRFSCMTTITCWKDVAPAGIGRTNAANAKDAAIFRCMVPPASIRCRSPTRRFLGSCWPEHSTFLEDR